MQQSHFRFSLLSAIASLFLASCTANLDVPDSESPPAPKGLSTEQEASLRGLGIPVAVPAYVPEGFQVADVIANSCVEDSPQTGACREGPH